MAVPLKQAFRRAGLSLPGLLVLGMLGRGVLAVYDVDLGPWVLRTGLAGAFAVASLMGLVGVAPPRWRWRAFAGDRVLLSRVRWRWETTAPSCDRGQGMAENRRRVFLDYRHQINAHKERAEFYHSLTTHCTRNSGLHSRVEPGLVPSSGKILARGHDPEYRYEAGILDTTGPLEELKRRRLVNARAQTADPA